MLGVDPSALAHMLLLSTFIGALLAIFLEILRFLFSLFESSSRTSEEGILHSSFLGSMCLAIRDIIFFSVCGVIFSVFIYYSNDGKVRFMAVAGVLFGFFAFYVSVSRVLRVVLEFIRKCLHKICLVLIYPFSCLFVFIFNHFKIFISRLRIRNNLKSVKTNDVGLY